MKLIGIGHCKKLMGNNREREKGVGERWKGYWIKKLWKQCGKKEGQSKGFYQCKRMEEGDE